MSLAEDSFLFFLKTPQLTDLINLVLEVCSSKLVEQGKSYFHQRILKCRELIFTEAVIASPKVLSSCQIVTIVSRKQYADPKFRANLERMGLQIVTAGETTLYALQECIHYTIEAKMAPAWNVVQNVLIQGRDFLTSTEPLEAVKMEVAVTREEIHLSLKASCVRIPQLKMEHFEHFRQNKLLEENNSTCSLVIPIQEEYYILPSLKKAKAKSISNCLSQQSVFKNYADLKKHWKNMYGYRLPNIPDEKMWYFNVTFRMDVKTTYTYPIFCVRPFGMKTVPRTDPRTSIHTFLSDFYRRVGNICGQNCQLLELKASFPALELYSAEDWVKDAKPRIGTTYTMQKSLPYRRDIAKQERSQGKELKIEKAANFATQNLTSQFAPAHNEENLTQSSMIAPTQPKKYIPKFYPKIKKTAVSRSSPVNLSKPVKFAPHFSSKQTVLVQTSSGFLKSVSVENVSHPKSKRKRDNFRQSTLTDSSAFAAKVRKVASENGKKDNRKSELSGKGGNVKKIKI